MDGFQKPVLVISRCLGFDNCRYNGQKIQDDFVDQIKNYANIITVCPESDIGLPTPRNSLRLVQKNKESELKIYQPENDTYYTEEMTEYINEFLNNLDQIAGFILKNRSPTCAISDAKIYNSENGVPSNKGAGIFTKMIKERFPNAIMEDEGRLTNFRIREDFLSKIYMKADFNNIRNTNEMANLIDFHSRNKYLLLTFNEEKMRKLGRITANHDKKDVSKVFDLYEKNLNKALMGESSYTKNINVLMHGMGYFKDKVESKEKKFFLKQLDKYRGNKVPLSVPLNIMKNWIIKYDVDYLKQQSFFEPYPEELTYLKDSAKNQRN